MKSYHIAVIPGDGTGPEVIAEGIKVLNEIGRKKELQFDFKQFDLGGEHFTHGKAIPRGGDTAKG